jgi:Icc-related predicted phosphoesterase
MKVIVVGDLHGVFKPLNQLIAAEAPDVVLQCGDLAYFWPGRKSKGKIKTNSTKVYWCPGNHENWATINRDYPPGGIYELEENIFLCAFGSVLELPDKRRVMFCGGAQSVDWRTRIPGESWWEDEIITDNDLKALSDPKMSSVDIVISHTKPKSFNFANHKSELKENDVSCRLLDEHVLKEFRPSHWYFGHFHRYEAGTYMGTNWTCLNEASARRSDAARAKGWWVRLPSEAE